MGFLDRIREAQREPIHQNWQHLHSPAELDEIVQASHHKPQIIFKHSTRCGISSMAKHQLEHEWDIDPASADMHYLDLIAHRETSNQIAADLAVVHQSPQIIIVYQGKAVFDTSHHAISVGSIKTALKAL